MASPSPPAGPGVTPSQSLVDDIAAAIRLSDFAWANKLAGTAVTLGVQHPIVFNARALFLQQQGKFREALVELARARTLAPNDANIANAIGVCLINLAQPTEAIAQFDIAIRLDPNNPQPIYRKGWTLEMLGERDEARALYERAIALVPNHADALSSLASILAGEGNTAEATSLAERALRIDPDQATALAALAVVDIANKEFVSAEQRLRAVLDDAKLTPRARTFVQGRLADALDGQDRADEAFQAYRTENNEIRSLYAQRYAGGPRLREAADFIASAIETAPAWQSSAPVTERPDGAAGHVFLLGFSRSGTTLLEQVLASHDRVVAMEEQEILGDFAQAYLTNPSGLERLSSLDAIAIGSHRRAYWQRVRDHGLDVGGKVFVDKLPLNTLKLPLIAKLFPDAKIIFALRDPRDIILSCFRRHFTINAAMFEFLTLEDAAEFYSATMRLAALCREKLPLNVHEHRYEDMVADFDTSVGAICDFIGVEWSNSLRDFHANTDLLPVRSPSAAQIRRPLNAESVRQWHRYKSHLAPILPLLQPWVERFGYQAD